MLDIVYRRMAQYRASNLSLSEVRRFSGIPDLDSYSGEKWANGLSTYIETAYNDDRKFFDEIVADYKSNINRKFQNDKGEEVSYNKAMDNFLIFMGRPENARKRYTANNFNKYLAAYYTEI
ncbi:MAG: hypothetical protein ACI4JM_10455 [Oscillospiraceae bacterium]